jgi:hypothetical protein
VELTRVLPRDISEVFWLALIRLAQKEPCTTPQMLVACDRGRTPRRCNGSRPISVFSADYISPASACRRFLARIILAIRDRHPA